MGNIDFRKDEMQHLAVCLVDIYQTNRKNCSRAALAKLTTLYQPFCERWSRIFRWENYAMRPNISAKEYEAAALFSLIYAAQNYDGTREASFLIFFYCYAQYAFLKYAENNADFLKVFKSRKDPEAPEGKTKPVYAIPLNTHDEQTLTEPDDDNAYLSRKRKEDLLRIEETKCRLENLQEDRRLPSKLRERAELVRHYMDFALMSDDSQESGTQEQFCKSVKKSRTTLHTAIEAVRQKLILES